MTHGALRATHQNKSRKTKKKKKRKKNPYLGLDRAVRREEREREGKNLHLLSTIYGDRVVVFRQAKV